MKAIVNEKVNVLEYVDIDKPVRKKDELLIEVKAFAINRKDILDKMSPRKDVPVLGIEVSGIVVESDDENFKKGDRVMGLVDYGAYAEYATMPTNRALKIPKNLSFIEAAAIPEVFLTAYQTLFTLGKLKDNESVLIHAGGSGVGTAAIQLAKSLTSAKVFTTASKDKLKVTKELGADININYKEVSFSDVVLKETDQQGVGLILDFVGASYFKQNYESIAVDGRWVLIGTLGGSQIESFDLLSLMLKRISMIGTLLTPRSDAYKAKLSHDFYQDTISLFEKGELKPVIDKVYDFKEINQAHQRMESNKNIGKIILEIREET